jgi:hypothetical protein
MMNWVVNHIYGILLGSLTVLVVTIVMQVNVFSKEFVDAMVQIMNVLNWVDWILMVISGISTFLSAIGSALKFLAFYQEIGILQQLFRI